MNERISVSGRPVSRMGAGENKLLSDENFDDELNANKAPGQVEIMYGTSLESNLLHVIRRCFVFIRCNC